MSVGGGSRVRHPSGSPSIHPFACTCTCTIHPHTQPSLNIVCCCVRTWDGQPASAKAECLPGWLGWAGLGWAGMTRRTLQTSLPLGVATYFTADLMHERATGGQSSLVCAAFALALPTVPSFSPPSPPPPSACLSSFFLLAFSLHVAFPRRRTRRGTGFGWVQCIVQCSAALGKAGRQAGRHGVAGQGLCAASTASQRMCPPLCTAKKEGDCSAHDARAQAPEQVRQG